MVFKSSDPSIKTIIDNFRTGKYGEDEYPDSIECSVCSAVINRGNDFYNVKGKYFCMGCTEAAEEHILNCYRDRFIYEL